MVIRIYSFVDEAVEETCFAPMARAMAVSLLSAGGM